MEWPGPLRGPLKARFDRHFYPCLSGDLGGEEGCASNRASATLEPPNDHIGRPASDHAAAASGDAPSLLVYTVYTTRTRRSSRC